MYKFKLLQFSVRMILINQFYFDIYFIDFQSDQYNYKQKLYISQYRLEDYTTRGKFLSKDNRWSHQFHMIHKSDGTTYTFNVKSDDQKMKLIKAIQDSM